LLQTENAPQLVLSAPQSSAGVSSTGEKNPRGQKSEGTPRTGPGWRWEETGKAEESKKE